MSPEGDHDLWSNWKPPDCNVRQGARCDIRLRVEERHKVLKDAIDELSYSLEHDLHTQEETAQLELEISTLHDAKRRIEVIEGLLEDERKFRGNTQHKE